MQNGILSYRNAAWHAMDSLKKLGPTEEQAYMLLACATVKSPVLTTANKPNASAQNAGSHKYSGAGSMR